MLSRKLDDRVAPIWLGRWSWNLYQQSIPATWTFGVTEGKLSSRQNSPICRQSAWIRWHYRHRIFITNCITTPYIRHLSAEYCKSCTLPTILKLYQGFGNCITRHRQTGGRPCGRASQPAHRQTDSIPFLQRPTTRIFHNSLIINLLLETPIIDTLLGKGCRKRVDFINYCRSTPYKISS